MRQWKNVPIPVRMQGLELDRRGYPIPFNILRDHEGKPHFQINDDEMSWKCIKERLCSICGQELLDDIWMTGGNLSVFHERGAFVDTPVHHECGQYAMQVCPYLAVQSYGKRIDLGTLDPEKFPGMVFMDPTIAPERPTFFALAKTRDYGVTVYNSGERYLHPEKPYIAFECWKDGVQISAEDAQQLLNEQYQNPPQIQKL
jgi:hypothetical protein